jgi:hypothetical protein
MHSGAAFYRHQLMCEQLRLHSRSMKDRADGALVRDEWQRELSPLPGAFAVAPVNRTSLSIVLVAVYAVFWLQFWVVRATNFGGIDEWMILSLASRLAVDIPYANRPLGLLFNLPAALFPSHPLQAALMVHGHYLVLAGMLTSLLLLRVAPSRPDLALVAGVCAANWAPSDVMRLDAIYSSAYSGCTAATALVFLLLAVSSERPVWVAIAAGLAFLTTRVHEGPLAVLLLAPLLLRALGVRLGRSTLVAYWSVMGLATLLVGLPLLRGRADSWYQKEVLGLYLDGPGLVLRMVEQFRLHLEPLVRASLADLLRPAPLAAASVVMFAMVVLGRSAVASTIGRRRLALAAGAGLLGAGAAYSGFVLAAKLPGATRTEFLATPWIGLTIGAAILLIGELVPYRARVALVSGLSAATAASGAARTANLQDTWDATSTYSLQADALGQMVRIAPCFAPGTLLIFIQRTPTWIGTFAFHHGLDVIYGRRIAGCVIPEQAPIFYRCLRTVDGVRHEAWPVLGKAWSAEPRAYRFGEIVVFRSDATGRVTLVEEWPAELPALPEGATYRPRQRIVADATPPNTRLGLPGF